MLKIEHLTKTYEGKKAVDDLSIHIEKGQIFGFIGHNGAGKTTTIKSVCGILDFDCGDILLDGVSVKEAPLLAKSKLAYIPDNPDLYDYMTGRGFIDFICDVFAVSKEDRDARIAHHAQGFQIEKDLSSTISTYSHGMKQKLAIIAALVHEPRLIVMDEPFVGLDPLAAHYLKQEMRAICDRGSSIFFSTHVLEVAEKLCDKVAIIKEGKLVLYGNMDDVRGDSTLESVFLGLAEEKEA